jgi:hypothetical protein
MCTEPETVDRKKAQDDLENALSSMGSVADVLDEIVDKKGASNAVAYLANQLHDHYDAAHDAFARIYSLNQYRSAEKRRLLGELSAIEAIDRDADADLLALILAYRHRHASWNKKEDGEPPAGYEGTGEILDKILATRPATPRGVLAVLDLISDLDLDQSLNWPAEAIEGLRAIAAREVQL